MHAVTNEEDFHPALSAQRAIIFCHADWSVPSSYAKRIIDRWYRGESEFDQKPRIPLFMVMPCEQAFVREWLASEGLANLACRGNGEVLWVEQGRVVDKILLNVNEGALRARTGQPKRAPQRWD